MTSAGESRDQRIAGRLGDATAFTLDSDGFACTRVFDEPEIWRVELLMSQTFLPSVNVFVVRDGAEALIVDTGTPDDYNDTRLMRALVRLGVDPSRSTLFCTHAHIDHAGQARELAEAGVRVTLARSTLADMRRFSTPTYCDYMADRLVAEGVGRAEAEELANSIWAHTTDFERDEVPFHVLDEGQMLRCGRWEFRTAPVPGHMPGQTALWLPERGVAFTGDVVLYACSTCICFWGGSEDALGDQLATLGKVADMGIEHAFLGHGLQEGVLADRCLGNVAHHERRSSRALAAVGEHPGSTGRQLVPALGWHVPFETWGQLPALTRWFLVSESVAHLDHLVCCGRICREKDDAGVNRYWLA